MTILASSDDIVSGRRRSLALSVWLESSVERRASNHDGGGLEGGRGEMQRVESGLWFSGGEGVPSVLLRAAADLGPQGSLAVDAGATVPAGNCPMRVQGSFSPLLRGER
jgi:hypothetical protein